MIAGNRIKNKSLWKEVTERLQRFEHLQMWIEVHVI